jgi:uncharacterized membrane protein YfcA
MAALAAGACLAGAMNAIAGGGTIVTFPLLVSFGMPAIQANATSATALLIGISGSLFGYRREIPAAKPWIRLFGPVSIIGGFIGAWLLTRTSEKVFDELVPFLLLFATILFLAGNAIAKWAGFDGNPAASHPAHKAAAVALQFGVAVYGGYFGAGIGILMLAALALIGHQKIAQMNAIKTVLGALINVVAAAYFVWCGLVAWPQAAVMTVGAGIGYYAGARLGTAIPPEAVRRMIVAIGLLLSGVFFWRTFIA